MHAHVRKRNEREVSLMIDQLCIDYVRQGKDHISRTDDRLLTYVSENEKLSSYKREHMIFSHNV